MVEHFTNYQLAAAVFILRNGNVPQGGICDLQVYLDELSDMVKFIIETVKKYPFPLRINAHIGGGNLHIVLCNMDLTD